MANGGQNRNGLRNVPTHGAGLLCEVPDVPLLVVTTGVDPDDGEDRGAGHLLGW